MNLGYKFGGVKPEIPYNVWVQSILLKKIKHTT